MKTKEKQTLGAMKKEELAKILLDARGALEIFGMNRYSKQSKNSREGRLLARKIAIIETLIRQKELVHE